MTEDGFQEGREPSPDRLPPIPSPGRKVYGFLRSQLRTYGIGVVLAMLFSAVICLLFGMRLSRQLEHRKLLREGTRIKGEVVFATVSSTSKTTKGLVRYRVTIGKDVYVRDREFRDPAAIREIKKKNKGDPLWIYHDPKQPKRQVTELDRHFAGSITLNVVLLLAPALLILAMVNWGFEIAWRYLRMRHSRIVWCRMTSQKGKVLQVVFDIAGRSYERKARASSEAARDYHLLGEPGDRDPRDASALLWQDPKAVPCYCGRRRIPRCLRVVTRNEWRWITGEDAS